MVTLFNAAKSAGNVSHRDIERVLAGDGSYDTLGEGEQSVVRATWDERVTEGLAGLDLEAELIAAGETWSEADDDGRIITRGADR